MIDFITDVEIYERVICDKVPKAKRFLWIATADIKDLYVGGKGVMVPFLQILSGLVEKQIAIRLLHAKEPGPRFREDFDRYPNLIGGMERILCPRVHVKSVIVDGEWAYMGSANLTGAGMGAKGKDKRNFEAGIVTDEAQLVDKIADQFDGIWGGSRCKQCKRKEYCSDHVDMAGR